MTAVGNRYGYPPRGLDQEAAARYLGISPAVFDDLLALRKLPWPRLVGSSSVWDRHELDAAFDVFPVDAGFKSSAPPVEEPRPHPEIYTPETLAKRWNCSTTHVRKMINRGDLPAFKIDERLLRIKVSDVVARECGEDL